MVPISSSVTLVTFQVLTSHMQAVSTAMDSTGRETVLGRAGLETARGESQCDTWLGI